MTPPLKKTLKYLSATMILMCFLGTGYAEMYKCQGRGGTVLRSVSCLSDEKTISIGGVPYTEIKKKAAASESLRLKNQQLKEREEQLRENERFLADKRRDAEAKIAQEKYREQKEYLVEGTLVCNSPWSVEEINKNGSLKDIYIKQEKCFLLPIKARYKTVGDPLSFCNCRKVMILPTLAAEHGFNVYVQSYLIPY